MPQMGARSKPLLQNSTICKETEAVDLVKNKSCQYRSCMDLVMSCVEAILYVELLHCGTKRKDCISTSIE